MNINKISKTVLALSLLFTSFSCSVAPTASQVVENKQINKSQENNGTIVVNLGSLFGSVSNKFSIKSYKYNDSAVEKIKISVYAPGSGATPEMEKTIKKSDNLSEVFLSVASGKNKVVSIETFDNKEVRLTKLMGAIDIYGGVNTTLRINYGTYPTADILKKLITENSTLSLAIVNNIELAKLEKFVNQITGYDINSNTYGGINPAYLDTDQIINHLKTNENLLNGVSVPSYKGDVKAYMFISSKNTEFGLYTSGSNSILYNTNNANIFAFQGKIAVGDIVFLKETDSSGNNEQEYQFNVVAVTANNITLDRNFIPATGRFVKGISFPDRKKYDNQVKGKLRLVVKNSAGQPIKGVKYELNDLTSENVSSSTDNITTIENISYGEFTLRVTANINGKTLQYKKTYNNITSTSLPVNDEVFTENIQLKENIPQTINGIRLERLNDNDNLPVPTSIDLSTGYSISFKAFIKMEDGTENEDVTWTSSNTNVANVSGGNVSAVGAGTATITVASRITPSISTSFTVNVTATQSNGPIINSFTPSGSGIDTEVIIRGSRFTNIDLVPLPVPTVKFNGTAATIVDFKENEIKVKVPSGATTGKISVQTSIGTFVSQDYFIVNTASNNVTTSGMVFIPSTDKFYMGSNGNTDDNFYPRHKVILNSFHIDRTEVTNQQFKQFINAGGYTTDNSGVGNNSIDNKPNINCWSDEGLRFRNDNGLNSSTARPFYWNDTRFNQPNQPVVGISWYEAQAYAKWAGKRLATEAEWEYAARGTNEIVYPWGGDSPSEGNKKANGFYGNLGSGDGYQYTNEVGKFNDGDSPFGLKDMSGNVYEWTNDYYDAKYYTENVANNPQGPSIGGSKVLRGGSWYNHPYFENNDSKISDSMKTYTRFYSSPANRSNYIGFRTAL